MTSLYGYEVAQIVYTVITGVALFPAIVLFALVVRKPGSKHDHTRRWVDLTKAALGLWSFSTLVNFINYIVFLVVRSQRGWGRPKGYDAMSIMSIIAILFYEASMIALFLAFFYLTHALTQLRNGAGADESREYRFGRKVALGSGFLLSFVALLSFCLSIASEAMQIERRNTGNYDDWETIFRLSEVSIYLRFSITFLLFIIGAVITFYAFRAFKKAQGSPVHKAARILLIAVALWDLSNLWNTIYVIVYLAHRYFPDWWYTIIDGLFHVWPTFAALALLYLLASKNSYGLSRVHYGAEVDDDDDEHIRV